MNEGDYIRTKDGVITKITDIIEDFSVDCDRDVFDLDELAMMEIPWDFKAEYIIKPSPNPIDLIEVGDYVNGMRVKDINYVAGFVIVNTSSISENTIFSYDIKSIVTKEQFKSMEYKVG